MDLTNEGILMRVFVAVAEYIELEAQFFSNFVFGRIGRGGLNLNVG